MKKDVFDLTAAEMKRASEKGAREDFIHIDSLSEGDDLRLSNPFGSGLKQERDESEQRNT